MLLWPGWPERVNGSPKTSVLVPRLRSPSWRIKRSISDVIEPPGHVSLRIPHVEARDVELNAMVRPRADRFYDGLVTADAFLAGVAILPVGGPAPKASNAVLR